MAILKNVEFWYPKLNPIRPSKKWDAKNPRWELQLRTTDRVQAKEWESFDLTVKPVIPDEGAPYYRVNLNKRSKKADGTANDPVEVLDGNLKPLDPDTIGNGSFGNVRIYQYPHVKEGGGTGTSTMLMKVQVTKLIKYERGPYDDDFEAESDTEIIEPEDGEGITPPSPKVPLSEDF